jgi:hypothetical protein
MNKELIKHNKELIKRIKSLNKKELIAINKNYYMPNQLRELIINLIKGSK